MYVLLGVKVGIDMMIEDENVGGVLLILIGVEEFVLRIEEEMMVDWVILFVEKMDIDGVVLLRIEEVMIVLFVEDEGM